MVVEADMAMAMNLQSWGEGGTLSVAVAGTIIDAYPEVRWSADNISHNEGLLS